MRDRQGGIIGATVTPTQSSASGVWTLREAERFKRGGTWPAAATTPGAPTSVSGTAGNAQVALTWTAPTSNGGSAITGYVVEYTPSGGSASTVSTGSATARYTVTGLTNGTAYTFRVAAINAVGTGAYSTASGSVTPGASSKIAFSGKPTGVFNTPWTDTGTTGYGLGLTASNWTGSGTAADPFILNNGASFTARYPTQYTGDSTGGSGNVVNADTLFYCYIKTTQNGTIYAACDNCDPESNNQITLEGAQWSTYGPDDNGNYNNAYISFDVLGCSVSKVISGASATYPAYFNVKILNTVSNLRIWMT